MSGDFIYRHHVEPRTQLYALDDDACPMPLKHADVVRQTKTDIDSIAEHVINDMWTENRNVNLSETGTTRFQILRARRPQGYKWVSGRPTKIQKSTRPDTCLVGSLDTFFKISDRAAKSAKQQSARRNW